MDYVRVDINIIVVCSRWKSPADENFHTRISMPILCHFEKTPSTIYGIFFFFLGMIKWCVENTKFYLLIYRNSRYRRFILFQVFFFYYLFVESFDITVTFDNTGILYSRYGIALRQSFLIRLVTNRCVKANTRE